MPELPEVETVCQGLAPIFERAVIKRVEQRRHDLRFPLPERFAARLEGVRVDHLKRRAKYIQVFLASGEVLVMHLGMSGKFTILPPANSSALLKRGLEEKSISISEPHIDRHNWSPHDHVIFYLDNGFTVVYNDPRRFGYMTLIHANALKTHKFFQNLGIEPLEGGLTPQFLASAAKGKSISLKAFLLDQRIIAGLGNIYVCEALFRAGLSPRRQAASLADARGQPTVRAQNLAPAIRDVLKEAIEAGGSSLRDYQKADGSLGYFQHCFKVYNRAGAPCTTPHCNATIRRILQNGRSTFYCPSCQR